MPDDTEATEATEATDDMYGSDSRGERGGTPAGRGFRGVHVVLVMAIAFGAGFLARGTIATTDPVAPMPPGVGVEGTPTAPALDEGQLRGGLPSGHPPIGEPTSTPAVDPAITPATTPAASPLPSPSRT